MTAVATAASAYQSATSAIEARKESVTTPPTTQTPAAKTTIAAGRASQRRDRPGPGAMVAMPLSPATTAGVTDPRNAGRAAGTESEMPCDPSPTVSVHTGDRGPLRPLFELAEDSPAQLDAYLAEGTVLVAHYDGAVVGHLQLVTPKPGEFEIKNIAVRPSHQRRGVGAALVAAALDEARAKGATIVQVATATADTANLRFYQRLGFRMREIERDAFTAATGYPPSSKEDGVALRDRVWLDRRP